MGSTLFGCVKLNVRSSVKYIIYWTNNLLAVIFTPLLHVTERIVTVLSAQIGRNNEICKDVEGEIQWATSQSASNFLYVFFIFKA